MGGRRSSNEPTLANLLGFSRRRPAQTTDDERRLWRLSMRDVVPLDGEAPEVFDEDPPEPAANTPADPPAETKPRPRGPVPEPMPVQVDRAGTPGVDRRTAERLRRGLLPIEGRIDLHGMDQAQAHIALAGFITHHWKLGARCVLVITGKGTRGEGVLKRAVPRWLTDPPLAARVLSFGQARPGDGGAGALYILLRRKRDAKPG